MGLTRAVKVATIGAVTFIVTLTGTPALASVSSIAAEQAPAETLGIHYSTGYPNRSECLSSQSNFARYYDIVAPCYDGGIYRWMFSYQDR